MSLQLAGRDVVARDYRRLSDAKGGTSIDRQGAGNSTAAIENGWQLGEPYSDDGLSASRYARKRRDDFDRLVADLESGPTGRESRFGADVLMLWESSRGSRKVGEWVSFIELLEDKGVLIWVTTHERLYDPRNGRDRKSLLEDAVDSEYESYKTHKRVTGTAEFEARRGRPSGRAPIGLRAVYDEKTGDLITWVEDTERSGMITELFRLLEGGTSLTSIEQLFIEKGYLNQSGTPYSRSHLRNMAVKHAYAGLRIHHGKVYEGTWDGIVPRERFWKVYRLLNSPRRRTSRDGRAKHELTNALWCGRCGDIHRVTKNKSGVPVYACRQECVTIQKGPVDAFIIGTQEEPGVLLQYLSRPDIHQLLAGPGVDEAAVAKVRAELAQLRAELDELNEATPNNLTEARTFAKSIDAKQADISALEEKERELTLPPSVLSLIEPGADVWTSWQQAPIGARREVAGIVLAPRYLGKVIVHPSPRTGPNQDVIERLEWRKESGPLRLMRA
ncbi:MULTISPECIES: recombinase family protein [unclassified Streptomyces]|uniref:recombinase family protein n=1 Tax=unclassified Streptomyces TaxID=2593676 RepID=UPI003801975E